MNMILAIIIAAICIGIGTALEPELSTTVATITTPTYSSGVAAFNGAIPVVSWLGGVWAVLYFLVKNKGV